MTTSKTLVDTPAADTLPLRVWAPLACGLVALYGPTLHTLINTIWSTDAQGHGPIVLALAVWLFHRNWPRSTSVAQDQPAPALGWPLLIFASLTYALGRSQSLLILEAGSAVPMLIGLIALLGGRLHLRALWFPLLFLCFAVPLPPQVVDTLTQPMKLAVSYVAEAVLGEFGLPIARSGVILQVGPYQLLVADACAGLQTLFTLEAMGLLYMNVFQHSSVLRNVSLALLIIPISFSANVVRVMALILITYYFGDDAGQGFLHGFAGMVLFMTSFLLIMATDSVLRSIAARRAANKPA